MRRILLASHGRVASGIKGALKILTGDVDNVTAVDCYVDESDFTPSIQEFIDSVGEGNDAIIFTDLLGGSVCNKVMTLQPEERGIVHVTGMNLALVLAFLLDDAPLTPKHVQQTIDLAASQIQCVSVAGQDDAGNGDDDDFFA